MMLLSQTIKLSLSPIYIYLNLCVGHWCDENAMVWANKKDAKKEMLKHVSMELLLAKHKLHREKGEA